MHHELATLTTAGGRPELRFERRLAHPPAKVWKAITEPGELAHWFPAHVEAELRAGAAMRFTFPEGKIDASVGEIVEIDPPKVFAYRWGDDLLRWELEPDGAGCRLLFTYTIAGTQTGGDVLSAPRNAAGWDGCLDLLDARLAGRVEEHSMQVWFVRSERYIEAFGLGEGEVGDVPDGYLVRFERDLVQPVEEVWSAFVQPAEPAEPAEPGHVPAESGIAVGGPPPLRMTNGYVSAGAVTAVEPARVVEYVWTHDGTPAGAVRWELREQPPLGCRLVVTQSVPAHLAELRATALAAWHTQLELFYAALHGDVRCPWPTERTEELQKLYADRLR